MSELGEANSGGLSPVIIILIVIVAISCCLCLLCAAGMILLFTSVDFSIGSWEFSSAMIHLLI